MDNKGINFRRGYRHVVKVLHVFSSAKDFVNLSVIGCVWKLLLNFGSPKSVLGNPHHEVQKSQNTFKRAFA